MIKSDLVRAFKNAQAKLNTFIEKKENFVKLEKICTLIAESYRCDGKVLISGNGGSMADAMHFAEELTGRFIKNRRPMPAISISDPTHISCTANDYGYDHIFSRYVEGLGKKNDTLILISTSGNSQNIIEAALKAKNIGMKTTGLLGKDGGKLKDLVDIPIIVPSKKSHRIQEIHIKIIHIIIELIERHFFPKNYK